MADEGPSAGPTVAPQVVTYCSVTGVPEEFNDYLPPDCMEFKKWKASQEGPEALEKLTLRDKDGNEIEKQLPGGKVKKKAKPQIVIETNTRNKSKKITIVTGLDLFGIKLSEASKMFKQKFACGCSVTKNASNVEQIEMQGDFLDQVIELVLKKYKEVPKSAIYFINEKKKEAYFDEESDSGDDA